MWQERELSDDADQVCLYCAVLIVVFLFSPLRFTDSLTQITGVRAVESALNGFAKRRLLSVLNHHRGPGDRLESDPMQSHGQTQGNDRNNATHQTEHTGRLAREASVRQTTETGEPISVAEKISVIRRLELKVKTTPDNISGCLKVVVNEEYGTTRNIID
jgi:hypothetical protein